MLLLTQGAGVTRLPPAAIRWLRFNLVGLLGCGVQLAILAALTQLTTWPATVCVTMAVLATVSHNFFWHERYTWGRETARAQVAARWVAFTLSNGIVSVVTNVVLTGAIASATGWPVLASNLASVASASCVNFLISGVVFAD
jgi:putative flippase GtrA